jgi:type II secretion system protein C
MGNCTTFENGVSQKWAGLYLISLLILSFPLHSETKNVVASDFGVTIMGAIVQKKAEDNVALIKDEQGKVAAVKKNHVILSGKYKVIAVYQDNVHIVDKNGQKFALFQNKFSISETKMPTTDAAANLVGLNDSFKEDGFERNKGKIQMTGMYRDNIVKNDLAKILMQATAEPFIGEDGQIAGFQVSQIDKGSIYDKSGIQDGDVITNINGNPLNNVPQTIKLLKNLKAESNFEVQLERNGSPLTLTIDVQ